MRNLLRKPRNPLKLVSAPRAVAKIFLEREYWQNGRKFLTRFKTRFYKVNGRTFVVDIRKSALEAPFSVALLAYDAKGKTEKVLFEAKLNFKSKVVTVVLQGGRGVSGEIRQFEGGAGMPVANFLCALIEKEAKHLGFEQVHLVKPEELKYYEHPVLKDELKRTSKGKDAAFIYFDIGESAAEKKEEDWYRQEIHRARECIQKRMKRLVNNVANARGYVEAKDSFIKDL